MSSGRGMPSSKVQTVLVIQEASREFCTNAIRHVLLELLLNPGDRIELLGIVQPFKTENAKPPAGCLTLRTRRKLHSSATIKKKQEDIEKEIRKKQDEYANSAEIIQAQRVAKMRQIEFKIEVQSGAVQEVATQYARSIQATWVILDRKLKKHQKYFADNLSCGILRMKHDNHIKCIREAKTAEAGLVPQESGKTSPTHMESCTMRDQQEIIPESSICSLCQYSRPETNHLKDFTFSDLQLATNAFSAQNLLSSCGMELYSGSLSDGQQVVIRKHTSAAFTRSDFNLQVQKLKTAKHDNVATLLGSCSEELHRLLVYEFACNGSLDRLLSTRSRELTWKMRMKIAVGAARGLRYLHRNNVYGNIRPSIILLTHDHHPKIANFGLVRNRYEGLNYSSSSETRVLKTLEYLPPEYAEKGIDWSNADVYSMGVVLLELITGRKTMEDTNGQSFLRWARPLMEQKKYHELLDPSLLNSLDLHQLHCMVRVADKCLSRNPKNRLSINKLVMVLTCISHGCDINDLSPTESEMECILRKK